MTSSRGGHLREDASVDDNPSGPVSDRMQALLSRAVEEQVSEQRAVSSVLADLRGQVVSLVDTVRRAASEQTVDRLADEVATVVADLRTTASLLGSRLDALASRVQQSTTDTAVPVEAATARMTALAAEVADQRAVLEDLHGAVAALASFPTALAALQKDVAGLHDRLSPLPEVRAALGDLASRTSTTLDGLSPRLDALQAKVQALGNVPDPERLRDAVVAALAGRLDALEQLAARPVVGPAELAAALATARTSLDQALDDRSVTLTAALGAADRRLGQVGERLSAIGDAAGGVPALATDLTRLAVRVEELQGLGTQVAGGVAELRGDTSSVTLALGLAGLREDVEELATRVADSAAPALEETASVVSARVADRLVETLAPRIADVVLTRVSAALVAQVSSALSPQVRLDTQEVVRAATADSERRVLAHVDESVLALAEALLRRRRGGRASIAPAAPGSVSAPPEGGPSEDDGSRALPAPVADATTGEVPAPVAEQPDVDTEPDSSVTLADAATAGGPFGDPAAGPSVATSPAPTSPAPTPPDPGPPVAATPDPRPPVAGPVGTQPSAPTTSGTGGPGPVVGRAAVTSSLAPVALTRPPGAFARAKTGPPDGRPGAGPVRQGLLAATSDLDDDSVDPVSRVQATPRTGMLPATSAAVSSGPLPHEPLPPGGPDPGSSAPHDSAARTGAETSDIDAPHPDAPQRVVSTPEPPQAEAGKGSPEEVAATEVATPPGATVALSGPTAQPEPESPALVPLTKRKAWWRPGG